MKNCTLCVLVVFMFSFLNTNAQDWQQLGQKINGNQANERFGEQVSMSDDGLTVAVGSAFSVYNNETGVVRVFRLIEGEWTQLGSDLVGDSEGDRFGQNMELSGDGNSIIVSEFGNRAAPNKGHVEVYKLVDESWQQVGDDIYGLTDPEQFGIGLDINFDGSIIAASSNFSTQPFDSGYAMIFRLENETWAQLGETIPGEASGDNFGWDLSLSSDGSKIAIGALELDPAGNNQGYVKVFRQQNDSWIQLGGKISGTRKGFQFGKSVSLDNLGNRVAIGASRWSFDDPSEDDRGDVSIFEFQDNSWIQLGAILKGEGTSDLASEVSISGDGNMVAIGASENNFRSGHIRVFSFKGTTWSQEGNDIDGEPGNDYGESVGMNLDGKRIIGGARFNSQAGSIAGQARVFEFNDQPAETEIAFDEGNRLIISDTNGGDSDDAFEISTNGNNLRITNSTNTISSSVAGSAQIDANTVEIPLSTITNGVFFRAEGGVNTMTISPDLDLSGPGGFLALFDLITMVDGVGNMQLNGLNVNNGSYDMNGTTINVNPGEAGFSNSILKGIGTLNGPLAMRNGATIAPGTSPGIINTGNLELTGDSIFDAEVNGQFPGTDHDQVAVTGTVSLNGAILNLIGGYDNAPTNVIVLIDNDEEDPISGTFADLAEGAAVNFGEFSGIISYDGGDGNDVVLKGNPVSEPGGLIITEIMYDPLGADGGWEWIEVYNKSPEAIDLANYVLDDISASSHSAANISGGIIASQQSAILFDVETTEEEFLNIWGDVDLIPVTDFPTLGNTSGDTIGLWDSFESYDGDNQDQLNTVEQVIYKNNEEGWPGNVSGASIFLNDLASDNNQGVNWELSGADVTTPLFNSYRANQRADQTGSDVGSPGVPNSEDTEAPMIVCPVPIVIPTDPGNCEAIFDLPAIEVTDNISAFEDLEIEITLDDGQALPDSYSYPLGDTEITIIATDEAGNPSDPCTVIITITDQESPEITCAPDISIVGTTSEMVEVMPPTVTDNCSIALEASAVRSDDATLTLNDPFDQGVTTITWTAIDDKNNMSICTQTVTIGTGSSMANDITNFGIPNQLPGTNIDLVEKTVNLKMPVGTDLTNLTPNVSISAGGSVSPETGIPQDFSEPVVYTITAEDGTIQEWTVTIEIEDDTEPPMVQCPENIEKDSDNGQCGAVVEFAPTATDNSGSVTVEADFMSGTEFPVGTTLVTITATDPSGNDSTCTFDVTVYDTEFPVISCVDTSVQLDSTGNAFISADDISDSMTDNCAIESIVVSPTSFTEENIGLNEVSLMVTDEHFNTSTCTVMVAVLPFESSALSITSFTLIDADTDEELFDLEEGDEIDINFLPTLHLDIRANTTEDVESVHISLDGALTTARTESLMPFALYRDFPIGDYIGEEFVVGTYAVSAIPYSENGLGGEVGTPFTINFELYDSTPTLSVTSFTLINADTDEPIRDLIDGETIDINDLETRHLDVRANTTDDVESVRISITGELMNERTESLPPYVLFRDLPIGDYIGADFVVGEYAVSAIPYSGNSLSGDMGTPLTANFELIDGDSVCESLTADVEVINPTICSGGGNITITPSGGTAPYEVGWINVSFTGETLEGVTSGIYSANVSDANGCSVVVRAEIEDPELPEVSLEPFSDVLVTELPLILTGGMPEGGEYSGEGVTAGIFESSVPGTYEITYTYEHPETECTNSALQEIIVKSKTSNDIIAFWLVNADNEEDLFPITDGMQIDISTLPTTNLDIRAETGTNTESVGFELSGTQSIMRGESVPPYALFQDLPIGDYIGHEFDLGEYTLSATPYSENSQQGDAGETSTIDFEFVDSTPTLAVTSFTLIDAETNLLIDIPLIDGAQFTLEEIGTLFLDIRANTTDDVESVRLELSGQQTTARTESLEPYALFRDFPINDYIGNNFELGIYTVTATPYSGNNMTGEMGTPLTITFEIVEDLELNSLKISPNQATTLARASFERPTEVEQILIFDMSGRMIESYNPQYIKSGDDYILDVNFYQQGSYIVKMVDNRGVPYQKQMVVKRQ